MSDIKPMSQEELDFCTAIEDYKKEKDKLFLSWCEVLQIAKDLGYRIPEREER